MLDVVNLIDRNREDDRGNGAVIRPEKRELNREIDCPIWLGLCVIPRLVFQRLNGVRGQERKKGMKRDIRGGWLNKNRVYRGRVSRFESWIDGTRTAELTTAWARKIGRFSCKSVHFSWNIGIAGFFIGGWSAFVYIYIPWLLKAIEAPRNTKLINNNF